MSQPLYFSSALGAASLVPQATPPHAHALPALQLAGACGRIAIEKPLATLPQHARTLKPSASIHRSLYPLDHKLFTMQSILFLDRCREDPSLLSQISDIEGTFLETVAFPPGRAQEDGIFDIQWHMLMFIIAAFKNLGRGFEIEIQSASTARHGSDPSATYSDATVCTGSSLTGTVWSQGLETGFRLLQVKAAPRNDKYLVFRGTRGNGLATVDLSESGWTPHERMLKELLRPMPEMRHTITDAVSLTELLSKVSAAAEERPEYGFGTVPSFFEFERCARASSNPQLSSTTEAADK